MYVPLVSQSLRLFCFIYHSELLLNFTSGDLQYMLVISGLNEGIWTENDCLFYWLLWFLNVCYLFYLQYFMYGFIEKWAQQQYFSGYFNSGSELNKYRLYSQEEKKEIWSIFTFSKWNNWIWNKTINKRLTWNFLFLQVYLRYLKHIHISKVQQVFFITVAD